MGSFRACRTIAAFPFGLAVGSSLGPSLRSRSSASRCVMVTLTESIEIDTFRYNVELGNSVSRKKMGPKLYTELASWFHLLSSPQDYAEEAEFAGKTLIEASRIPIREVLELGSGGGN